MFFYRYGRIDLPYCQNSFQTHLLSIAGNGVQANLKAIFKQFLVCLLPALAFALHGWQRQR
jgi:hypothetical protein